MACSLCSVQLKPFWNDLAKILKGHPEIILAKMDADENEKDPYYLPERHIPVIKLFKKVEELICCSCMPG
jgi:hypothetical protein